MRWIHRSPVKSPDRGKWCGALMFSLICTCTNVWANHPYAGDLRCHRTHYDVIVMTLQYCYDTLYSIMWIMCRSDRLITVSDHVITVSECAILYNNIHHIFGRWFCLINGFMLHVALKIRVGGDLGSSYCVSNAMWNLFDVCRFRIKNNISNDMTYILYSVVEKIHCYKS